MYYIKNGDVWATPRKQKGQPKGKAQKVASTGLDMDYSRYIYFLDGDGDVARKERALGGGGRKAKAGKSKAAPTKVRASTVPAADDAGERPRTRGGKKSDEQLDREIEECIALAKAKRGGNGKPASKPAGKKKRR